MPKQQWLTEDGHVFDNELDADIHELTVNIDAVLDKIAGESTPDRPISAGEITNYLSANSSEIALFQRWANTLSKRASSSRISRR